MKRKNICRNIVCLAALFCLCLSAFFALNFGTSFADTTAPTGEFKVQDGAEVRLEDPNGLRFITTVSEEYKNSLQSLYPDCTYEYGTVLSAKGDEEDVETKVWVSENEYKTLVYDIPAEEYSTAVTAQSYVKVYSGGTLQNTFYSSNTVSRSVGQVASYALADGNDDEQLKTYAQDLSSITFAEEEIFVEVGSSVSVTATTAPANYSYKLTSNDNSVATVADGKVTAVALGSTTVTASLLNVNATCTVYTYNTAIVSDETLDNTYDFYFSGDVSSVTVESRAVDFTAKDGLVSIKRSTFVKDKINKIVVNGSKSFAVNVLSSVDFGDGKIDFEDGKVSSAIKRPEGCTISVIKGSSLNGNYLCKLTPNSSTVRIHFYFEYLKAVFTNTDVAYLAFDVKTPYGLFAGGFNGTDIYAKSYVSILEKKEDNVVTLGLSRALWEGYLSSNHTDANITLQTLNGEGEWTKVDWVYVDNFRPYEWRTEDLTVTFEQWKANTAIINSTGSLTVAEGNGVIEGKYFYGLDTTVGSATIDITFSETYLNKVFENSNVDYLAFAVKVDLDAYELVTEKFVNYTLVKLSKKNGVITYGISREMYEGVKTSLSNKDSRRIRFQGRKIGESSNSKLSYFYLDNIRPYKLTDNDLVINFDDDVLTFIVSKGETRTDVTYNLGVFERSDGNYVYGSQKNAYSVTVKINISTAYVKAVFAKQDIEYLAFDVILGDTESDDWSAKTLGGVDLTELSNKDGIVTLGLSRSDYQNLDLSGDNVILALRRQKDSSWVSLTNWGIDNIRPYISTPTE